MASNLTEAQARLDRAGQGSVLRFWDALSEDERAQLLEQLGQVDWDRVKRLVDDLVLDPSYKPRVPEGAIDPIDVIRLSRSEADKNRWEQAAARGEEMLARGEVAVVIVAGGQGSRLGFPGPKGTYPIGPVSTASLFQIHAEKIRARTARHKARIPLFIMTSPENHAATLEFFQAHGNFGLEHVRFFVQGQLPAVDAQTGRALLAEPGKLALAPDGHGGTLRALSVPGANGQPSCLDEMEQLGCKTIFYFQVDNPLVKIADPAFLGFHELADADVSFKVVEKTDPDERVGVVISRAGRPEVIEYSNLPAELAARRAPSGGLELWAGSIAIHVFDRAFLERIGRTAMLPMHRALKKVAHVDDLGTPVSPEKPNAIKFESFIFDVLPIAERWTIVETDRWSEFEPLKNATGAESAASVRQRMSDVFASWLEAAGSQVPRRSDGTTPFGIEISPLFALDAAELRGKIPPGLRVDGPLYLSPIHREWEAPAAS